MFANEIAGGVQGIGQPLDALQVRRREDRPWLPVVGSRIIIIEVDRADPLGDGDVEREHVEVVPDPL